MWITQPFVHLQINTTIYGVVRVGSYHKRYLSPAKAFGRRSKSEDTRYSGDLIGELSNSLDPVATINSEARTGPAPAGFSNL